MSGLEVVIVVGGAIYVAKKVKERKERKRLEREAASELGPDHARVTEATPTPNRNSQNGSLRQQVPAVEDEALPLYRAPTGPPPSNTTDMRWADSIHLPTYEELSEKPGKEFAVDGEKGQDDNRMLRPNSNQPSSSSSTPLASPLSPALAQTSHLTPNGPSSERTEKKRVFWRRSSSAKAPAV